MFTLMFIPRMDEEMKKLEERSLIQESNGCKIVDLNEFGLNVAVLTKNDGATLYITRDIAAASHRHEIYQFDRMYYVVADQQNYHFQQLFKVLEKMGYKWAGNCQHVAFGLVKGMSTRKGNVVFLEDILTEATSRITEVIQKNNRIPDDPELVTKIAQHLGLSAVVIQDLSARRIKDYTFDWSRITSFEGDTGPYLQYAHARLCSLEKKALEKGLQLTVTVNFELLTQREAHQVLNILSKYPSVVQNAMAQLEPCVLVNYLMDLSHSISLAHEKLRVITEDKEVAEARLLLFWAARQVLGNGLKIVGLTPLEKM